SPLPRREPAAASRATRACSQPGAHPCELLPRPDGLVREPSVLAPVDDRLPRLGALGEPALPLEQEGAAVEGADVLRIELERAPPVGQRALHVAQARFRLTAR